MVYSIFMYIYTVYMYTIYRAVAILIKRKKEKVSGSGVFGALVPNEHRLNVTAYLSIVADHVHPFMTTVYPSSDG